MTASTAAKKYDVQASPSLRDQAVGVAVQDVEMDAVRLLVTIFDVPEHAQQDTHGVDVMGDQPLHILENANPRQFASEIFDRVIDNAAALLVLKSSIQPLRTEGLAREATSENISAFSIGSKIWRCDVIEMLLGMRVGG